MRLAIAETYIARYGNERAAMILFADDLMKDDPSTFKRGYSRENAVIATAEAFGVERESVDDLVKR